MKQRLLQSNFTSGELDPLMAFRSDTGAYANGAARLRNTLMYATGGVARRPGTEDKASLVGEARVIPFDFANDERYLFVLTNGRLDVYDSAGASVTNVASGVSWTTANLFELTYTQRADVMVIAHQDFAPQVITRTGASTFTVTDLAFREAANGEQVFQPYFKFADDAVTLSCSATTGSGVNITANSAIFTSDWVGVRLRWHQTEIEITGFTSTTVLVGTIQGTLRGELLENPYRTTNGSTTVTVTHVAHGFVTGDSVTFSGSADTGGITAAQLNGARTITVLNDNEYTFVAGGSATDSVDGGGPAVEFTGANLPSRNWDEQVFSEINGWPGACLFHEARLWLAGSGGIPDGMWSSRLFDYFNFAINEGTEIDSIQVTLGSDDITNIRHLVSNGDLQIFTATGDYFAAAPRNSSLTPANITVRQQTPYGSSLVRPAVFDNATIYIQATQSGLREYLYNEATQRYASTDLNVLSSHLVVSPTDMGVSFGNTSRPEQYAYVINSDGTMGVFYSARSESQAGWCLWQLGGTGSPEFVSVAVLGNDVWFVIKRDSAYRLQKLSNTTANSIDGMTQYTGAAASAWVVGSQYYNQTVSVRSGTYYLGEFAVDGSGNITLDDEVTSIDVGYDFDLKVETLPANVQLQSGNYMGLPKRINRTMVAIHEAYSLSVDGEDLQIRTTPGDLSLPPDPLTTTQSFYRLGYDKKAAVVITQPAPQPAAILGASMEVSF